MKILNNILNWLFFTITIKGRTIDKLIIESKIMQEKGWEVKKHMQVGTIYNGFYIVMWKINRIK